MPASPDYSPFIPPLPSPYGPPTGIVPSPPPSQDSDREDMNRRPRNGTQGSWPEGWTPPGMMYGPRLPPGGYPVYATPHHPSRPGMTPMQPSHAIFGASPWPGYPPPPGHVPPYHSVSYVPGALPQVYGPTPYQPYHPMYSTPHSVAPGFQNWGPGGTPLAIAPSLEHDPIGVPFLPTDRPDEGMIRVGRWEQGLNYGPVLTPFQVAVLDVKLLINPFLAPPSEIPSQNKPHLIYNFLFPLGKARRSVDPQSKSWSSGRLSPATWPRVSKLNIISREFPWVFEIHAARAERGVTCLDVIEGLYENLQSIVPRHQIEALIGPKGETHKRRLYETYHFNRSTEFGAPGGSLGEGVRKVDWLLNRVMFDGIVDDQAFVQEKLGIKGRGWNGLQKKSGSKDAKDAKKESTKERVLSWPATVVLRLDVWYSDAEADRGSVISDATDVTEETHTQLSEHA